jgi:segregation and condensation protein B
LAESTLTPELQHLEAVLLLSRQPQNSRRLAQLAGLEDGTQARTLLQRLNQFYDRVGRSFHIKRVAGGYQLRTRPQYSRWIRQLIPQAELPRLTTPALETLTVVAYRQPIIKADIEAIRGVNCGEMLRQLLEKNLIRIVGRSEQLGHPFFYGTTRKFLVDFGLPNLESLPQAKFLRDQGLPQWVTFDQNSSNPINEPKQTVIQPETDPTELPKEN